MVRSVVLSMEDFARLQAGEHVQGKRPSSRKAGEVLLLSISYAKRLRNSDICVPCRVVR